MKKWKEINLVEEMSRIHDIKGLKHFFKEKGDILKKAMLPAVVCFALVFFWFAGSGEEGLIVSSDDSFSQNPQVQALSGEGADSGGQAGSDELPDGVSDESFRTDLSSMVIYVDIGGEVVNPGVYQVAGGTRLFQVIEEAGGLKESADTDSINRAETVTDGQKIIIGSRDESSPYYTGWTGGYTDLEGNLTSASGPSGASGTSGNSRGSGSSSASGQAVRETDDGYVVNINLATLQQLQLLPGVGPSTAEKITDYREKNGKFSRIEDIKNISGIGEKTYQNLKDFIEI